METAAAVEATRKKLAEKQTAEDAETKNQDDKKAAVGAPAEAPSLAPTAPTPTLAAPPAASVAKVVAPSRARKVNSVDDPQGSSAAQGAAETIKVTEKPSSLVTKTPPDLTKVKSASAKLFSPASPLASSQTGDAR